MKHPSNSWSHADKLARRVGRGPHDSFLQRDRSGSAPRLPWHDWPYCSYAATNSICRRSRLQMKRGYYGPRETVHRCICNQRAFPTVDVNPKFVAPESTYTHVLPGRGCCYRRCAKKACSIRNTCGVLFRVSPPLPLESDATTRHNIYACYKNCLLHLMFDDKGVQRH